LVVSCCDGAVDLEMSEDALDAIALAVEAFVVADCDLPVRLRWDDSFDAAPLQVGPDCIGIVRFIGQKRLGLPLGQIDQIVVGFAVCRFAWREVEGDRPAPGITETMNFTGEPAPRAAKSSSMNPPFPPAAETWARTEVESML
jgi:hypothetical protein